MHEQQRCPIQDIDDATGHKSTHVTEIVYRHVIVPARTSRSSRILTSCGASLLYQSSRRRVPPSEPSARLHHGPGAVLLLCYRHLMAVRKKRSVSMPPELDAEIAAAAAQAGMTYSSWLAATARKEFTIRAGLAAVSQFEDEHGAFTAEELAEASQWAAEAVERGNQTRAGDQRRSA